MYEILHLKIIKELIRCLTEGEIRGAGLDVFANEPDVPEELFGLDNVVLSPHSTTFTVESFKDLPQLWWANFFAISSSLGSSNFGC
ncbi:hypothetical protein Dsin_026252 [Dipteronia sinensis]|uniref:D-isomer specific 2-hydroxyacid dehydrogenase NAD-binding domain-containing protein n=1 Tax=Dipteronia sinensis TaxID=43782 RepID=A0AAE0DXQ0_9ROSI|nr:hypothetical protein Dsin_026252 [Dipteronia sinensis]